MRSGCPCESDILERMQGVPKVSKCCQVAMCGTLKTAQSLSLLWKMDCFSHTREDILCTRWLVSRIVVEFGSGQSNCCTIMRVESRGHSELISQPPVDGFLIQSVCVSKINGIICGIAIPRVPCR